MYSFCNSVFNSIFHTTFYRGEIIRAELRDELDNLEFPAILLSWKLWIYDVIVEPRRIGETLAKR